MAAEGAMYPAPSRRRDNGLLAEAGQRVIVIHTVFAQHAAVWPCEWPCEAGVGHDDHLRQGTVCYIWTSKATVPSSSVHAAWCHRVWWEMPKVITERMPAFAIMFTPRASRFSGYITPGMASIAL